MKDNSQRPAATSGCPPIPTLAGAQSAWAGDPGVPRGPRPDAGREGGPAPAPALTRALRPCAAPALDSADAGDLTDALCEFDAVLADFASPFHERHFHYEEHLERMKRRSSASVSDSSGFSDSESECGAAAEAVAPRAVRAPGPRGSALGSRLRVLLRQTAGGGSGRASPEAQSRL